MVEGGGGGTNLMTDVFDIKESLIYKAEIITIRWMR